MDTLQYLPTKQGHKLAYRYSPGASLGVVFLAGFMSDMEGSKACFLEQACKKLGLSYLRFDYSGHGKSEGIFSEGTIGQWTKDTLAMIDQITTGPQILIGSSMGGWIGLLAAKARRNRIKAFIGIAAAPDFTVRLWNRELSAAQKQEILQKGFVAIPTEYGDVPYIITDRFIKDGWENRVLHQPLNLDIPVRLLQGMEDKDVPWDTPMHIAKALGGKNVDITLVPKANHSMSCDSDLARLEQTLQALVAKLR